MGGGSTLEMWGRPRPEQRSNPGWDGEGGNMAITQGSYAKSQVHTLYMLGEKSRKWVKRSDYYSYHYPAWGEGNTPKLTVGERPASATPTPIPTKQMCVCIRPLHPATNPRPHIEEGHQGPATARKPTGDPFPSGHHA